MSGNTYKIGLNPVERGNPTPEQAKAFLNAGYSEKQIPAIILAQDVSLVFK